MLASVGFPAGGARATVVSLWYNGPEVRLSRVSGALDFIFANAKNVLLGHGTPGDRGFPVSGEHDRISPWR